MLDSYKVLSGDKARINGEGFERLRKEQSSKERLSSTSQLNTEDIDPINDETKMDSQQLEIYRRKKFSAKHMNFTQSSLATRRNSLDPFDDRIYPLSPKT
jgi:hypothetical protein